MYLHLIETPATAANGLPSGATAGKSLRRVSAGDNYEGFSERELTDGQRSITALVWSTAGSGTMTVTVRLWGWDPKTATWFVVKALNGGTAIPEQGDDIIRFSEEVPGFLGDFTRCYAEITAIAGTGTAIRVSLISRG